jgi:ribosomal peptide maturation radical SAM protein 1
MPFASVERPALGVSLLKSELKDIGIATHIHYFNLNYAERISLRLYERIEEFVGPSLVGEMIFAKYAFGRFQSKRQYIEILNCILEKYHATPAYLKKIIDELSYAEESVTEFIEECASIILEERPKLVGFSSTFQQNCASLALARRIKETSNIPIIFGGANCEGEMGSGLLKCAPWVDFVCSGEGDIAFIEFVKSFVKNEPFNKINGIITRRSNNLDISLTNPVMNLNSIPFPDFDDYFVAVNLSILQKDIQPILTLETSRGCWWGEKSQCTFCGLNGLTMKYRSKSIPRALNEIRHLVNKYKIRYFGVVDNILDLKYIDGLFPELYSQRLEVELFYETKSNISKKQLITMKQGGVTSIQPGIESIIDSVLKIMKKGVSSLQNILLLKWCKEIGIVPYWNFIWGFPGESEEEYGKVSKIIPLLVHLHPPESYGKIHLDRFSPYFVEPLQNNLVNIRPLPVYSWIYPLSREDLQKIAYHFDFEYASGRDPKFYTCEIIQELENWQKSWDNDAPPVLLMIISDNFLMIVDTRPCAVQNLQLLEDEEAKMYEMCETPKTFHDILMNIQVVFPSITENQLNNILSSFINKKLILCINDRFLSLAIQVDLYGILRDEDVRKFVQESGNDLILARKIADAVTLATKQKI